MPYATTQTPRTGWRALGAAAAILICLASAEVRAQEQYPGDGRIGLDPKLGVTLPLDLAFRDSEGRDVTLGELIDRPAILSLVYIRCPSICNPLMREVARMVDLVPMKIGEEYKILTLSFDHREHEPENADLVRNAKGALLKGIEGEVPPESYVFLTGTKENIGKLCDTVGFYFAEDEVGNYSHPPATIFVSKQGKVVRYLEDLVLLPDNVELALIDAMEGRERTTMRKLQKLCFAYDPEAKKYVLQVNRIILAGTLVILAVFLGFLLFRRRSRPEAPEVNS